MKNKKQQQYFVCKAYSCVQMVPSYYHNTSGKVGSFYGIRDFQVLICIEKNPTKKKSSINPTKMINFHEKIQTLDHPRGKFKERCKLC